MNHLPLHVRVPIEGNNPSITRLEEKCMIYLHFTLNLFIFGNI